MCKITNYEKKRCKSPTIKLRGEDDIITEEFGHRRLNIGVSNRFYFVEDVRFHCEEASKALSTTRNRLESCATAYFNEQMLDTMLLQLKKNRPRSAYCPDFLIEFIRADKESDGELTPILRAPLISSG